MSTTEREALERADLSDLRRVLHALSPQALASIGVTIERPDPDRWIWLRDLIADALENLGRTRAASNLREYPFGGVHTQYSIGISAQLLDEMAARITARFTAARSAADVDQ